MAYIVVSDNFVRQCEITTFKSILWHELFLDPTGGDFQIQLSADKYFNYIKKGYFIINTDSKKFGIIDTFEVVETKEDGILMTVSGQMGESILQRRIVWPTSYLVGPVDEVVSLLVRFNITEPENESRKIPNFEYEYNPYCNAIVTTQITGKNLGDAIASIAGQFGYGFIVRINDTFDGFVMELKKGVDRSANQLEYPVIVFSTADYGISEFRYLYSDKATFSHVICAGEGEGALRTAIIYPSTSTENTRGINRREVFLDKKDLSKNTGTDSELTDSEYIAMLKNEAAEKLTESSTDEACEGIIVPYHYKIYRDFNPGDIVTVRNERLGMEYDIRVLGALISIDENGATDTTAEMGNLVVTSVEDEDADDDVVSDEADNSVDASRIKLSESIIDITVSGGNLIECASDGSAAEAVGTPFGVFHIFDNARSEFVFTANTRYVSIPSASDLTLGTLEFSLKKNQGVVLTEKILSELNGMVIPVYLASSTAISTGFVRISNPTATKTKDEKGDSITNITANTTCYFGAMSGVCTLVASFVRAIKTAWDPDDYNPDNDHNDDDFTVTWEPVTAWNGVEFNGYDVWSDGTHIYVGAYYELTDTSWMSKTWTADAMNNAGQSIMDTWNSESVWTDGNNTFYSDTLQDHCVLDKNNSHWKKTSWNVNSISGKYIWHGKKYIFYSSGSTQYALVGSEWHSAADNWSGLTNFRGNQIWLDGDNYYYSNDTKHYVLDGWNWTPVAWRGVDSFYGENVWTAWGKVFLSFTKQNTNYHYALNKETQTWEPIDWGFKFNGKDVWKKGNDIYCSNGLKHYKLKKVFEN